MVASLIAAIVSALCYGVAVVMQAAAAREASTRSTPGTAGAPALGVDPGLLPRMLRQWRFLLSLGLDGLGFVAQLVALQRLPLFAVQAIVAANLAVAAVGVSLVMKARLSGKEWAAVVGVMAGVGLLGSSAGPEGATAPGEVFKLWLIVATAVMGGAGLAAARLRDPLRTPLLGMVAGLGFGVVGIAARVLTGLRPLSLATDPATYAIVVAGIVAFLFYATALEGGSVTAATAAVVLAETLPPALIGVMFLGDKTRPGLEPAAAAGFVLAVVSAVTLARYGEADQPAVPEDPAGTEPPGNAEHSGSTEHLGHTEHPGSTARLAGPGDAARPDHDDPGEVPGECPVT